MLLRIRQNKKILSIICSICFLLCWNTSAFAIDEGKSESNDEDKNIADYHFQNGLQIDLTDGGIAIGKGDGTNIFVISGQVALIHSGFGGAYNVDAFGDGHFTQETQLQTMRLGFSGNATKTWGYTAQLANRANSSGDGNDDVYVRLANLSYNGWDWAHLIIGRSAPFFGVDNMHDLYNLYGTDFSSLSNAFAPPIAIGLGLQSTDKSQPWLWNVGIYHTNSTVRESRSDLHGERGYQEESHLYLGRLGRILFDDELKKRLLFAQASVYRLSGSDNAVSPINLDGGILGTLIPSVSPPITSGQLSTEATQGQSYVYDIGISAVNGPFSFETEYAQLRTHYHHIGRGHPQYHSALVQAGWVLTGESREFDHSAGYLLGVEPTSPRGAFELVGRAENIDLLSHAGINNSRTGNKASVYTAGVVWYVSKHVRFAADANHLHVTGPSAAKQSGNGATVEANFFF